MEQSAPEGRPSVVVGPWPARRLYVQPSMFSSATPPPCLGELTLAAVDGVWSVGLSVTNLATLLPIAITAQPGQSEVGARAEAHAALDELLDVLGELSGSGPFD